MPAWSEVLGDGAIRREKPLGMARRLKPLHPSLPLARGLMRVLRTVVEVAVLAMLHARQDLSLGGPIAFEFIRDDHPWNVLTALEELAEELLSSVLVPSPLHQDVEHHAVLVHRPPQIVPLLVNRDEYFIQVLLITRPGTPPTQLIGVLLAKLTTPFANSFVRDGYTTDEQDLFHIAVAERKAEIEPDGVANDLSGEAMMFVRIG